MPSGIYPRKPPSKETKLKISKALMGHQHSQKTLRKISESRKGKVFGKEHPNWKEKINKLCRNCKEKFSVIPSREETAKFCSPFCRQKYFWQLPSYRTSFINKLKGRPSLHKGGHLTAEVKRKISISVINNPNRNFRDTSIELKMECLLQKLGIEYQKQFSLYNTAVVDFYVPSKKLVIQCDGCFYHGCPIHNPNWIKNKERDKKQDIALTLRGIKVLRFWEHEINSENFAINEVVERSP